MSMTFEMNVEVQQTGIENFLRAKLKVGDRGMCWGNKIMKKISSWNITIILFWTNTDR